MVPRPPCRLPSIHIPSSFSLCLRVSYSLCRNIKAIAQHFHHLLQQTAIMIGENKYDLSPLIFAVAKKTKKNHSKYQRAKILHFKKHETINKLKFLEQRLSELGMLTIWTKKEKRQTGDNFKSKLEAPLSFKLMSPCARCFPKKWEEKNKQRRWLVSSSQLICLGNDGEESKPLPAVWSQRIWEKIHHVRSSGYPHCRRLHSLIKCFLLIDCLL